MKEELTQEGKKRRLIIGIIIIGAFISSLNQTVMTASLPRVMEEFGIGAGIGQWLTTGYLLFMGVMIPCTGYLMERFSSKKLYLASVSLFLIGCGLAAFAPNIFILLLARVIQALGAGILLPLPQVVAFRLYEPEKRGTIMGIVGLTTGFAPAFGPTFAGWIVDSFGWRAIFYIMCVLAILGILLAIFKLPEEKTQLRDPMDIPSVLLSTIGFCGLLTGVTNQGNYGTTSVLTIIPFLLGLVCVLLFAVRQLRLKKPLLELRVFQSRNFTFGTLLLVFAYGSMLSVSTLLPVYVQTLRGCSATLSGLIMLPGALFLAFLNPVTGRILDKKGPYLLSVGGLLCLGGATLFLGFIGDNTPPAYLAVVYGIRMLGIVALLQPLQTWAVNAVDSRYLAHGTALMNTVRQVGGAIMSALFVTIMSATAKKGGNLKGIQNSFFATAAVIFVCLVVAAVFMRSRSKKEEALKPESSLEPLSAEGSRVVITIAREYGSGGREIGRRTAQALGIDFYDRELIALEARESGFADDYVESHDDSLPVGSRMWDFAANSYGAYESNLFQKGNFSMADSMFEAQKKVIRRVAAKGSCVVIGRCGNYILKDERGGLRIFVYADMEKRLDKIIKAYQTAPKNAEKEARRRDAERAYHHKRYTGENWKDFEGYDMILNSGALGIEKCVDLILEAVKKKDSTL